MNLLSRRDPDIRLAGQADADVLLSLLRERHRESGIGPFSELKVRRVLLDLIAQSGGIALVCKGRNGGIEGTIGLMLSVPWDSDEVFLKGLFLFVPEQHRRSSNAKRLIEAAKLYADRLSCRFSLEEVENPATERKIQLYGRQLATTARLFSYPPLHLVEKTNEAGSVTPP